MHRTIVILGDPSPLSQLFFLFFFNETTGQTFCSRISSHTLPSSTSTRRPRGVILFWGGSNLGAKALRLSLLATGCVPIQLLNKASPPNHSTAVNTRVEVTVTPKAERSTLAIIFLHETCFLSFSDKT